MAGVVLENLSNRKLIILGVAMLLLLVGMFLVGGIIAPAPSNVQNVLGTKCIGKDRDGIKLYYSRGNDSCQAVDSLDMDNPVIKKNEVGASDIVFVFQFPLPRGGDLQMSRWFQNLISVIVIDIAYNKAKPFGKNGEDPIVTMDSRLGFRNKGDPDHHWTEIARSLENRTLNCKIQKKEDGYPMMCDILPFFELGSCHHDYYLVNIRLPVESEMNTYIGDPKDLHLVVINQNGGFTKVWMSVKSVMFPALLAALAWFWKRIAQLDRMPTLLEKTLFALGLTLSFLNLPVEFLSLWIDMPFMLLLTDIRQGIFYAMLLCFWIIFAGEHTMDQLERSRLVMYWKHLSAVLFACICLLIFDMCERGVKLANPFFSIWATQTGTNISLAFIILAGVSACLYFLFLCYMLFKVFKNITAKKSALPQMSKARRKYYMGLIYRFNFLMVLTLLCAALTVIFFIISQVSEGNWKWGSHPGGQVKPFHMDLQYTSAFFTGVYGMWNIYVIGLLILYAPSHKYKPLPQTGDSSADDVVEFSTMPSEAVSLTAFAKKTAAD